MKGIEKRKYIRINTIFPVEFRLLNNGNSPISGWIQGFSRDISKGGLCLFTNVISWIFWDKLKNSKCRLELIIHLPFSAFTINVKGFPVWVRKGKKKEEGRFYLGLSFLDISRRSQNKLLRFAYGKKIAPKLVVAGFLIVLSVLGFGMYKHQQIVQKNQRAVREITEVMEELSIKRQFLEQNKVVSRMLSRKIEKMNTDLASISSALDSWKGKYSRLKEKEEKLQEKGVEYEEKIEQKKEEAISKIEALEEKLRELKQRNKMLKKRAEKHESFSKQTEQELRDTIEKKEECHKVAIKDMYQWLKKHRDLNTGLVRSFEGDVKLSDWGFTYDQALCINVFLLFDNYKAAKRILDFYLRKAERHKGGYLNAYYVTDGSPCEYIVHSGPNLWLGLSALRYIEKTGDGSYFPIVKNVARFILAMQDNEGGIKGGPAVSWYATEHNLDAYSFFVQLYENTKEEKCLRAKRAVQEWIKKYSYTNKEIPVNRGKGDSTIATDTYTWSIASLGPAVLYNMDMNPEDIMDFAINNCKVQTVFQKEAGAVEIKGFDFAKRRHLPRGGVVSCEWTAQMILSLRILADFYEKRGNKKKSIYYDNLAERYLEELGKMIISSPSPTGQGKGCLPYASQSGVQTGHGWRTPKGQDTCSVAATAYYILAYFEDNPLSPDLVLNSGRGNNE